MTEVKKPVTATRPDSNKLDHVDSAAGVTAKLKRPARKVKDPAVPFGTIEVKNIHFKDIQLGDERIKPGETGLATKAEASFFGKYLELV